MKIRKINLSIVLLVVAYANCTKPEPPFRVGTGGTPPQNHSIRVDANMNITLDQPMNFAMLNGRVSSPGGNVATLNWQKLSGPASCTIENPKDRETKVSNLEIGVYQFKFTATNTWGSAASDTVTVVVQNATSLKRQIVFWNLHWICPMGCSIDLGNIVPYISTTSSFTVYIKRQGFQNWEVVFPEYNGATERYSYSFDGQLSVFENLKLNAADHPEIKIVW